MATVFCQGCPWRCPYCHNPDLIPATGDTIEWASILKILSARKGLLDGVVFSGGEPTLQRGLLASIRQVRDLGYRVGLHTAGAYPQRLAEVLPHVDWVGFDIKAAFEDYAVITATPGVASKVRRSLEFLKASGVDFVTRTTMYPTFFDDQAVERLGKTIKLNGLPNHVFQEFRPVQPG